ncbi:TPA: hypothetical protein DEP90_01670 [Patescibacteria group bacterium]|nr:hypothetical protein [Patescibacteria group bacterium]
MRLASDISNLTDATDTKVTLDTEIYDIGSDFDSTTNNRFTAPVSGYYLIIGTVHWKGITADSRLEAKIFINGSETQTQAALGNSNTARVTSQCVSVEYVASTQYIELYGRQTSGTTTVDIDGGTETYLIVHLLSV